MIRAESAPLAGRDALLVFFKVPRAGAVKTRLAPLLGAEGAARVHRRMVERTLETLADPCAPWAVRLCFAPDHAAPEVAAWLGEGRDLRPQGDGDLGARMSRAFAAAFADGARRVAVVGTDAPELVAADVAGLFDALTADVASARHAAGPAVPGADVAVLPAADGGYAALALARPAPGIFRDVPWSTDAVMATTAARAASLDLRLTRLRTVSDVDTPADWLALPPDLRAALLA
jgi:rSAM/selenodomain-associated transferase 1